MNIFKYLFLIFSLVSLPFSLFCLATDQEKLTLPNDWQFIRTSNQVSAWKLKEHPQTILVFQSDKRTTEIDWKDIESTAFFQQFKTQKQEAFDMIGISEWVATHYQWNNNNNHFELIVKGSYKNSSAEVIFFHEVHLFFEKITHQILFTSIDPKLIEANNAQHSIDTIKKHLITNTENSKSSDTSFFYKSRKKFFNNTRKLFSVCFPTAYAYNSECKECHTSTTELKDVQNICQVLLNSPPCETVPKDKKAHCNYSVQLKEDAEFKQSNIWDYVRGCTTGVTNPVKKVLQFTWDFMRSVITNITGKQKPKVVRNKVTEYINNVKLYLHTEFEKKYDRNKKGVRRAVSAIKAVGGTIGNTIFGTVSSLLFSKLKGLKCLNAKGKSESVCEFVSNTFMLSTNYITLLTHGEKFLTAKQVIDLQNAFAKVNETLQTKNNISDQNFTQLANAEDILNRPLSKIQKQEVVFLLNKKKESEPTSNQTTNEINNKESSLTSTDSAESGMKSKKTNTPKAAEKPANRFVSRIKNAEQVLGRTLRSSEKRTLMQLSSAREDVARRRLKRKGLKLHEIDKLFEAGVL